MNHCRCLTVASATLLVLAAGSDARADEYKATLDLAAKIEFLDKYFGRGGYATAQTITRDKRGYHFKLPAVKGVAQTTTYSYFALAGDFEFSVEYELINVPRPTSGYGASVGIAVESKEKATQVQLSRGARPKEGNGYLVNEGSLDEEGKMKWKPQHYPAQAKSGRLVLRREKKELICLVADKPKDDPIELCRLEFNDSTIQKIRVFADPGDFPTVVEGRITNIQVRANEITGGVPLSEQGRNWGWLWTALAILALPALGYWWWRHKRIEQE